VTSIAIPKKLQSLKGKQMEKDGEYLVSVYMGDTLVELRGYDREVEYAYIGDENITEMLHGLDAWPHVRELAEEERPWHG
jgi:hypothetical protein